MASDTVKHRCDECGKYLGRRTDLERHMQLHAPDEERLKFPCTHSGCKYKALQRSNLKIHMYTHTGERPYKCPEDGCDFDTRDPGALTKHRRSKHGYRPKEKSSTGARKTTKPRSRFTPYSTSSRPSRNTRDSVVSEDASSSSIEPQVSPPDPPQSVDTCLPSLAVAPGGRAQQLKNGTLAFETEPVLQIARDNDSHSDTPSDSSSSARPEVPAADSTGSMFLLEQESFSTHNQPNEPLSQPTLQSIADAELEYFLARFDEYMARALSMSTSQSNRNVPIPTDFSEPTLNTLDDTLMSATLFLPSFHTQHQQNQWDDINNTHSQSYDNYDYYTQSFDGGHTQSNPFAQDTFPDWLVDPQAVASEFLNEIYSYTAPLDLDDFPDMQDSYMF